MLNMKSTEHKMLETYMEEALDGFSEEGLWNLGKRYILRTNHSSNIKIRYENIRLHSRKGKEMLLNEKNAERYGW